MNLPFIEVLKLLMKGAVEDYLTESGVLAALAAIPAKATKKTMKTLTPKVLTDLAANNRNANGFMERILYVFLHSTSRLRGVKSCQGLSG